MVHFGVNMPDVNFHINIFMDYLHIKILICFGFSHSEVLFFKKLFWIITLGPDLLKTKTIMDYHFRA